MKTGESLYRAFPVHGLDIRGNLFLAPLAGYSDAAFRAVCVRYGAALTFTEMVSAEALRRTNEKTLDLLKRAPNETHLGIQIFASNAVSAAASARILRRYEPSVIDLNCGCSVRKILKSGCGASLLRTPQAIGTIIRAIQGEVPFPVSVKIRSGWDAGSVQYVEIAQIAEQAGASWVTLHPRTAKQGFSGTAQWDQIRILKRNITVPVVGSGDLFTCEDAASMLHRTRCDAVMFARGALGNPFIFQHTRTRLDEGSTPPKTDPEERLLTALDHLSAAVEMKGERIASREMRKHFCAYTKGLPNSSRLRAGAVRAACRNDYETLVREYLTDYVH